MTRSYNFIKSIVKDNYELFKDLMPYQEAMERAINTDLEPVNIINIFHPTLSFNSKDELKAQLLEELQYEVNMVSRKGFNRGNQLSILETLQKVFT